MKLLDTSIFYNNSKKACYEIICGISHDDPWRHIRIEVGIKVHDVMRYIIQEMYNETVV